MSNRHREPKNNDRHWCKYCEIFIHPNQASIKNHEEGWSHKIKVNKYLDAQKKAKKYGEIEAMKHQREIQSIIKAGEKEYDEKDGYYLAQAQAQAQAQDQMSQLIEQQQQWAAQFMQPQQYNTVEEYNAACQQYYQSYYSNYYYTDATGAAGGTDLYQQYEQQYEQQPQQYQQQYQHQQQYQQNNRNQHNNGTSGAANKKAMEKQKQLEMIQKIKEQVEKESASQEYKGFSQKEHDIIAKKMQEFNEKKKEKEDSLQQKKQKQLNGEDDDEDEDEEEEDEDEDDGEQKISVTDDTTGIGSWVSVRSTDGMFGSNGKENDDQSTNTDNQNNDYNDNDEDDNELGNNSEDEETIDMTKRISHASKTGSSSNSKAALLNSTNSKQDELHVPKVQFAFKKTLSNKNIRKKTQDNDN